MLNKKLLTAEDANSILYHFGKGFCDYYTLNTQVLTTMDTWFAWDFVDVIRITDSIKFNIKNSLWTGGFRVMDSNIGSPSVDVSGDSIVVSGSGLEWVILVLELSPEFNYGEIFELDYQVEYTPVIRPFYEDIALTMGFLDGPYIATDNARLTDHNDSMWSAVNLFNRGTDYTTFTYTAISTTYTEISGDVRIEFDIQTDASANNSNFISIRNNSTFLVQATRYSLGMSSDNWYHIKIEINNNQCVITNTDNGRSITGDVTNYNRFYLRVGANESIYFKNLKVYSETPITGMTVTDKITGKTLTTDSSGLVSVISPLAEHGDFDYVLEAENNLHTVDYNFPYQRIQCELPVVLVNPVLYRDKLNLLIFKFLFDDEYNITKDMLFKDNHIRLRANGVFYDVKKYNTDSFSFEVPLGLKDYADLHLIINGNDYLEDYTLDYSILTRFVTCEDSSDLKSELEGDNPAGTVYYTGSVLDETISISNDVRLVFSGLVECSLDSVFTVTDGASLVLDNVSFTGKRLVEITDGSVTVKNSSFQHCTDTIITGTGSLSVETSSFTDNYSCLDIDGDIVLRDTLFDLSDNEYLDTVKPAFIRCFKDLTVDYCQFNLDLHGLTSLGLSYVMFYLGRDGTVNTVANKTLMKNEVFPVAKNTGTVDVESEHYHITGKNNKCMIWTLQDTNTVYSNNLNVEYVGDD